MHLGQLSTNDSYSPWVSEHDGENRIELLSVVFKFPLREGGQVLAKIDVDTLKQRKPPILVEKYCSVINQIQSDLDRF